MSIVTLKKKFQAQYNNSSVGLPQFSLNGTRRSSGYVGQDMLGRSLVRSLSRNGALKGHGGCCGAYPTPEIKTSPEMCGLNNPDVVKPSSLTTSGLFMTRHRWVRRPEPFSSTKPGQRLKNKTQSWYINYIIRKTVLHETLAKTPVLDSSGCNIIGTTKPNNCCPFTKTHNYNANINSNKHPVSLKPAHYTGAISASQYIRYLDKQCGVNDLYSQPRTIRGVPFACKNVV